MEKTGGSSYLKWKLGSCWESESSKEGKGMQGETKE